MPPLAPALSYTQDCTQDCTQDRTQHRSTLACASRAAWMCPACGSCVAVGVRYAVGVMVMHALPVDHEWLSMVDGCPPMLSLALSMQGTPLPPAHHAPHAPATCDTHCARGCTSPVRSPD